MNEFEEGFGAKFKVTDPTTMDGLLLARAEAVRGLVKSQHFEHALLQLMRAFPIDLEQIAERAFMNLLGGVERPDEAGILQVELCTLSQRLKDSGALVRYPEIEGLNHADSDLVLLRLRHRFKALMASIDRIDYEK